VEVDTKSDHKNSYIAVRNNEIVGVFYVFEEVEFEEFK